MVLPCRSSRRVFCPWAAMPASVNMMMANAFIFLLLNHTACEIAGLKLSRELGGGAQFERKSLFDCALQHGKQRGMRFEGQIIRAPIPGVAESTASNLPIPEIRKDLALPGKMEGQTRTGVLDRIPTFSEAAQKRQVVCLAFRTRHPRQVHDCSVFPFCTRPIGFLLHQARRWWQF